MTNVQQQGQVVKGEDALSEYSDDTLAGMADELAKEAERLGRLARGAHAELQARVVERDATKLDTEHWEGTMTPGAINHTIDDVSRLRDRLKELVSADEIVDVFVYPPAPPMRVGHAALNELHKRGGEIAALIDEERRSVRGEDRLVLTRKPGGEGNPDQPTAPNKDKKQPTWPGLLLSGGP